LNGSWLSCRENFWVLIAMKSLGMEVPSHPFSNTSKQSEIKGLWLISKPNRELCLEKR
jgi:hypothetical protein